MQKPLWYKHRSPYAYKGVCCLEEAKGPCMHMGFFYTIDGFESQAMDVTS